MHIRECLLDRSNTTPVPGGTVAELVAAAGHASLWESRGGVGIDTVVLHYVSAPGPEPFWVPAIIALFCRLGVDSHYLLERDGTVWRLVPEEHKAWHAGASIMPPPDSRVGVNAFSIGIEMIAMADSGFTDAQYQSLSMLSRDIVSRHPIRSWVGHEDVAGVEAVRLGLRAEPKIDPGPLFDWERFTYPI